MLHITFCICTSLAGWTFPSLIIIEKKPKGLCIYFSIFKIIKNIIIFYCFLRCKSLDLVSPDMLSSIWESKHSTAVLKQVWWLRNTGLQNVRNQFYKALKLFLIKSFTKFGKQIMFPTSWDSFLRSLSGCALGDGINGNPWGTMQ